MIASTTILLIIYGMQHTISTKFTWKMLQNWLASDVFSNQKLFLAFI